MFLYFAVVVVETIILKDGRCETLSKEGPK